MRATTVLASLALLAAGCRDCDGLGNVQPQGVIEPAIFDFGPVTTGSTCTGSLGIKNNGNSDLEVESASIVDESGDFSIVETPPLVGLGAVGDLKVRYTAAGDVGARQRGTIKVVSNDPDGDLVATVEAVVADVPSAIAKTRCTVAGAEQAPCETLDFGAATVDEAALPIESRQGITLSVTVVNDGNAELTLALAQVGGGDGDFAVIGARRGSIVVDTFPGEPIVVEPGRTGDCGEVVADAENEVTIDVKYAPTALGADAAELTIVTDALEGAEIVVPLSGVGAATGIVTNPDVLVFGDVAEGSSDVQTVRVKNVGTADARVDESCIDLGGDGSCDALCTGEADETADGLSCVVTTTEGGVSGKGFVLSATDATEGGDDERDVSVTYAPTAGASDFPAGTVLRLQSNILNNRVFEVPIGGGAVPLLDIGSDDACSAGSGSICLPAAGTPGDTTTWTGEATFVLTNVGGASLSITSFSWEGPATIVDDYELQDDAGAAVSLSSPGITLAPDASRTLTIAYANDDASGADIVNLIVEHSGLGGQETLQIQIVPPT